MTKRRNVSDLHTEWMKEEAYAKAYEDLAPEFEMAAAIIEARTKARLTQNELARRMGTTQTVVARLESGSGMPSTRTLTRIADATGLKMQVMFAEKALAASSLPEKPNAPGSKLARDHRTGLYTKFTAARRKKKAALESGKGGRSKRK